MSDSRLPISAVRNPSPVEIDASCRLPLLALFPGAALWLLLSAVAALLASMSFHKPDIFADSMWLSYGRILPFSKTLLIYGFCLPAGYGIALWIAARLSRVKLAVPAFAMIGGKLWHLGVLIGSFGILCGASTGHEGFEMPFYAAITLFVGALLMSAVGLITIHQRTEREMYPSLWFIITGFLWFPWILSTAIVLLDTAPVRGVAQSSVLAWFVNNLQFVTLGLFGMAAGLYFIPKLADKPLRSRYLAFFTLVTLVLFGSWTGVAAGGPLPAWIGVLSSVAAVFAVIPAFAHIDNLRGSCCFKTIEPEAKFFSLGVPIFFVATLLAAVGAFVHVTQFTLYRTGQQMLLVQGFFALTALGGIYHILPKVADLKWPFARLVRAHFWLAILGVLLIALPYAVGGWMQGVKLNNPSLPFVDIARSTLMPIRMVSVGELLWLLGGLLFAANVFALVYRWVRVVARPIVEAAAPIEASEVRA